MEEHGHGHGHGAAASPAESSHHHGHAHDAEGNCVTDGHAHGHGHAEPSALPLPPSHGRELTILYGSQTGTAQDVAEGLGRSAERYAIDATVCAADDVEPSRLPQLALLVVVCSTTGDGATPDNMKTIYRSLLRKSLLAWTHKALLAGLNTWQNYILEMQEQKEEGLNFQLHFSQVKNQHLMMLPLVVVHIM